MKVGIDIGNRKSSISIRRPDGSLLSIPDATFSHYLETPSTICLDQETILVGLPAEMKLTQEVSIPFYRAFKQAVGSERALFINNQQHWYVETFLTLLLKKLKYDCETFCGTPIESAVLSIPNFFEAKEKKAILIAASLADIPVLDLISEATAIAHAYIDETKEILEGLFLAYDFGASSLDITILHLSDAGIETVLQQSNPQFRSALIIEKIKDFLILSLEKSKGRILVYSPYCLRQLEEIAEEIFITLSDPTVFYIKKQILVDKDTITLLLDRPSLEALITPVIEASLTGFLKLMFANGLTTDDLDGVFLAGGAASLSLVREKIAAKFSMDASKICLKNHRKAASFGATLHAQSITQNLALPNLPKEFKGISGHNIGLQTFSSELGSYAIDTVLEQNLPLPCQGSRVYYLTPVEGQTTLIDVVVYQGTEEVAVSIGKMILNSILNKEPNQTIEVVLTNTVLGTVEVTVYCRQTGEELTAIFPYLTKEDQRILEQRQLVAEVLVNDFI